MVALLRSDSRLRSERLRAADAEAILEDRLGLLAGEARSAAAEELRRWRTRGIELLAPDDHDYPAQLRDGDIGPLLFVRGRLQSAGRCGVAVVGTRHPSTEGVASADAVASRLAAAGTAVVSGLAAGIDSVAHTAAMTAGGRTIAVIGCGLDHCYPPQNQALQGRIAADGAVVSLFWPETRPSRRTFPERNRLMAAMTSATVIVEAGPTSGTRIQARHALALGRAVVLLPGAAAQSWAQELARRPGVTVVDQAADVVETLNVGRPALMEVG